MKTILPLPALAALLLAATSCENQQANRSGAVDPGYEDYGYYPSDSGSSNANNPYATDSAYGSYQQSAARGDRDYVSTAPSNPYVSGSGAQMPSDQGSITPLPPGNTPAYGQSSSPSSAGLAQSHVVSQGETLYRISKIYGSTVEGIKSANGLNSDMIHPGDVLNIP